MTSPFNNAVVTTDQTRLETATDFFLAPLEIPPSSDPPLILGEVSVKTSDWVEEVMAARKLVVQVYDLATKMLRRRSETKNFEIVDGKLETTDLGAVVLGIFTRKSELLISHYLTNEVVAPDVGILAEEALKHDICNIFGRPPLGEWAAAIAHAGNGFLECSLRRLRTRSAMRSSKAQAERYRKSKREIHAALHAAVREHGALDVFEVVLTYPHHMVGWIEDSIARFNPRWIASDHSIRSDLSFMRKQLNATAPVVFHCWEITNSVLHGGPRVSLMVGVVRGPNAHALMIAMSRTWQNRTGGVGYAYNADHRLDARLGAGHVTTLNWESPEAELLAERFASSSFFLNPGVKGISRGVTSIRPLAEVWARLKRQNAPTSLVATLAVAPAPTYQTLFPNRPPYIGQL